MYILRLTILMGLIFFLKGYQVACQVGIGTTTPTAQLEIEAASTGIPALELVPQTSPVGGSTGQLAVINDKLYLYDATRGKWLSIEVISLNYGWAGNADNQLLWFGGDIENTGPLMPLDGTIVYVSVNSSGGNTTKRFDLRINGVDVGNNANPTLDGRFNLSSGEFSYSSFNIDFNAGDYITINAANPGSGVDDPTAIIWVKWRN